MVATNGHSNGTVTEYEGIVSRVNDRGILFQGREGWLNVSKFAGLVELPDVGARVRCKLDSSGFIRSIAVLDAPAAENTAPAPTDGQNRTTARETAITRMACLNTAVAIMTTHGAVYIDQVFDVAEQLEGWVLR